MNMETLGKLAAPASAKIRQLQKIVQDIKKNDGSLLNKLRSISLHGSRLKSKPIPKVPARDYRDDDQLSEPDYDNDTYEDPHEDHDDSYEPPPRGHHQNFNTTPAASYPKGEYLDNHRNQPQRPPRKPVRPSKGSKQLPPKPTGMGSDDEDYINPDGNDDDNYIEPEENPPSNPMMHGMSKVGKNSPMLSTPLPERPPSPGELNVSCKQTMSNPHNTVTYFTAKAQPQEPTGDDEYEVCDPHDSTSDKAAEGPPPLKPKPVPRERSPKPPVRPRPDLKPREFESRTLPVMPTEQKTSPKAFSLDFHKRPKIPLPHFTPLKPADRGSISSENGSLDQDKDADVHRKSWYASTCDRKTADDVLFRVNKDGAFMVRKSSGQDAQQPYTLVVFYNGRVYNIPIRFIPTTQQYALGREKRGEEYFSSVSHIIENHQRNPLVLIDSQSNTKDATKLCFPVKP
ncbi:B-cell linker protein [Collichthys lucidus]|uniref:B-cell linker protein n=1 Tax=Collichthys lucidus TaxID=240159 RepID=A0A4U5VBQ8_COLLU|nr:B-cell linker protein [Collichthys lucidus]